ncbi:unnamed protein product [Chilo suppressalis]|uniref:SH3 domain-containing protein n=1 Tax=Chilo suppressalis TaxID=168631 RepID=A0ABN8B2H3_CHISP|nr:unnamed protein product [Chilo suppressalis]
MANMLKRTFSSIHSREREAPGSSAAAGRGDVAPPASQEDGDAMNRDNVSTKIAAGMDRWQNTFEEMINLRSSHSQAFKDNYWAQNAFDELRRYVKQGSDFSKELAAILQERVEAENYYSKCLAKLGTKLSKACKESVGSCAEAWKHVALEMEKRAEIHRNYSNALSDELVKPMKNVADNQLKLRKKIEGNVDKTTRTLAEWRTAEAKSKKQSHTAARENEKLQDASLEMSRLSRSSSVGHIPHSILSTARAERHANASSEKDAAKLQVKKRKTEDAVKKTEVEYYNVCALLKILQLVKQDIDRERKSKQGLEKLSMAMKQTPTFGNDDSQQNVADKLYHVRSMLTYLEAIRYKITTSLNELDSRPPVQHPLSTHIQIVRDKQGLQQSILKVPPWLQSDYQNEVNKNLQPNYTALSKSMTGGEERERRDSIMSRASSKLRIEHLSFRRNTENKSAPGTPVMCELPLPPPPKPPTPESAPPESPLDWSERGAGDGLSNQHDSDFDEFSSQSDSSADLTDIMKAEENGDGTAPAQAIGKCRALYTYEARLNDELNLTPGDIISIFEKQDDGWWSGDLNGCYGIFPSSYVEEITTCI